MRKPGFAISGIVGMSFAISESARLSIAFRFLSFSSTDALFSRFVTVRLQ